MKTKAHTVVALAILGAALAACFSSWYAHDKIEGLKYKTGSVRDRLFEIERQLPSEATPFQRLHNADHRVERIDFVDGTSLNLGTNSTFQGLPVLNVNVAYYPDFDFLQLTIERQVGTHDDPRRNRFNIPTLGQRTYLYPYAQIKRTVVDHESVVFPRKK